MSLIIARLSHPNVVEVFDVGTVSDARVGTTVFLAMALAEGLTLRMWARAPGRTWRERLGAVIAAGEGLVAAHRIGLVHRDIKPDNVLVDRDGRVRVADFGLARLATLDDGGVAALNVVGDDEMARTLAGSLTATGTIVGTPIYMAPEQLAGSDATFASDLYAFCAAAHEVFTGVPPFVGTRAKIMEHKHDAVFVRPTSRELPPAWVLDVLERGMAPDPRDRPQSIETLLTSLRRRSHGTGRRALAIGFGTVAAAIAVGVAVRDPVDDCAAQAWNRDRSGALRADAVSAVGSAADGRLAATVAGGLAARADMIAAGIDAACSQAAPPAADLECWKQHAGELDAVAKRIARGDLASADVVQLQSRLGSGDQCRDAATGLSPPADRRAQVEALREALVTARIERWSGDAARALAAVAVVVEDAEAIDWLPLHARALHERAATKRTLGDGPGAFDDYRRAFFEASEAGDDDTAVIAALELAIVTSLPGRVDEAQQWLRHADAVMTRYAASPHHRARRHAVAGSLALVTYDFEAAQRELDAAERVCAAADCGLADAGLVNLRADLACRQRAPSCVDLLRARATRAANDYGPDGRIAINAEIEIMQGLVYADRGAEAIVLAERLYGRIEELGLSHASFVASLHLFHGLALLGEGRCEQADAALRRIGEFGDTDTHALPLHAAQADIALCMGDLAAAMRHSEIMIEFAAPRQPWESAPAMLRQAAALLAMDRADEAETRLLQARIAYAEAPATNAFVLSAFSEVDARIADARHDDARAAFHRYLARQLLASHCPGRRVTFGLDYRPQCDD